MAGPYINIGGQQQSLEDPAAPGLVSLGQPARIMRMDLMRPASELPLEQQVVVPPSPDAVPLLSQIGRMNVAPPAQPLSFEQQTMRTLEQAQPTGPGAQMKRGADAPAKTPAATPAAPSWRKLVADEQKKREAVRDAAAEQVGQSTARFQEASDKLVGVQQAGLEAEARAADTVAGAYQGAQQRVNELANVDAQRRQAEDAARASKEQEIGLGYKALEDATIEDRRTPADRALSIFSVALAGIGDALMAYSGQKGNSQAQAMQTVQTMLEQDADRQLEQLSRKREGLSSKDVALQRFVNQVGDDRAARDLLVKKQWDDLAHLSDQVAARTQNELKRNAAVELGAHAKQQSAAAELAGMTGALEKAATRAQQLGDLGFELSLKQTLGTGKPKQGPAAYGLRKLADGTPEDAKKAQEIASGFAGINTTISQLKAMAAKGATLSPDERATARRRLQSLKSQFNGTFGDGTAPNEAQLEALDEMFLNPTEVNLGNARKQFEVFEQDAASTADAKMRPYGYATERGDVRPE